MARFTRDDIRHGRAADVDSSTGSGVQEPGPVRHLVIFPALVIGAGRPVVGGGAGLSLARPAGDV
jgi:hypothetical protein